MASNTPTLINHIVVNQLTSQSGAAAKSTGKLLIITGLCLVQDDSSSRVHGKFTVTMQP
jgi:hypothetical protein